jgi:hypothetical protein
MFKFLARLFQDEIGGLGVVFGSIISAVADLTGEDSTDSVVKIKRLINTKGNEFCDIADFDFLRSDISFSITTANYKYSGASYLPTTFKKVIAAYLLDGTDRCPLEEISVSELYALPNPDDNDGRPDKFCITRIESGYYEIAFNRTPDNTYTVYFEIELQWTDLSSSTDESVVTTPFLPYFAQFVSIDRAAQQGDTELQASLNNRWYNPMNPIDSMLTRMLKKISHPLKKKGAVIDMNKCGQSVNVVKGDYNQ